MMNIMNLGGMILLEIFLCFITARDVFWESFRGVGVRSEGTYIIDFQQLLAWMIWHYGCMDRRALLQLFFFSFFDYNM